MLRLEHALWYVCVLSSLCVMLIERLFFFQVIILCFAVFFGGTSPSNLWSSQKYAEYTTAPGMYVGTVYT